MRAPDGMEVVGWMIFTHDGRPWKFAATGWRLAESERINEDAGEFAAEYGPFTLRPAYARIGMMPEDPK